MLADRKNIVVLDGHALNPGDLSWHCLEVFGNLKIYPRTPAELVVERTREAHLVLTNKTPLMRDTLERLPHLRYIGVLATGYNVVDVAYAISRGIVVTNVPSYGVQAVAQMVFALLLELTNRVGMHSDQVADGAWSRSPDWCFWDQPILELAELTMGIVGYGAIGQRVAQLARAFGMEVLVTARHAQAINEHQVRFADLDTLLATSDVVTLHCPLTSLTHGMLDQRRLALMKRTALLINTARGGLVEEHSLAVALNEGRLAGAGLDVLSVEPPEFNHPLLRAKNCIVTPHIAWASRAARQRLLSIAIGNLESFLQGTVLNSVGTTSRPSADCFHLT